MNRRDLFKNSLVMSALALGRGRVYASPGPAAEFPKAPGLTKYVAEFIVNTKYADIPADVLDLGKKSILDGFGLALAGSASVMGPLVRQYVQSLGLGDVKASVIGTGMKAHTRFAAFARSRITWVWKWNARLPKPSRHAITTKVFIPPARADRSAAPRPAPSCEA